MFTEGLDESAIEWVKQGSDVKVEEPCIRSPLTEKITLDPFPQSPVAYNVNGRTSSHDLPPLKFHSGLLSPQVPGGLVAPRLDDSDGDNDESLASAPDDEDGNYSDEEGLGPHEFESLEKSISQCYNEEELFGYQFSKFIKSERRNVNLKRGLLNENLKIEVPENFRRFTDGEFGFRKCAQKNLTPGGSNQLRKRAHLHTAHGTPTHGSMFNDSVDLGTPSAPPIIDRGREEKRTEIEIQQDGDYEGLAVNEQADSGLCQSRESYGFDGVREDLTDWKTNTIDTTDIGERLKKALPEDKAKQIPHGKVSPFHQSPYYNTSGQYAWQTLITYDACIRLCLHEWARGCTEAPEFLHDECLVLRSALGLHKFLLQPRGVKPTEGSNTRNAEQICPLKVKKVVGKIRVEVRKVRVIPKQKLKSTYSLRGAYYMQAGADYARHISSLVKSGINSLKLASLSVTSEEPFSCLIQLKSATEETEAEPGSAISLRPGSGDYHVFFPESQGDALLIDVQDTKKTVHGQTRIPISSLNDNPTMQNDRNRWWPIYHDEHECVGKIQLYIGSTMTSDETDHIKSAPVVETVAYDLLLEASMRAQHFHSRNLWLHGSWKWLLTEFAEYYGVSDSYTKLRYLLHVMNVATPTKDCLELVKELLLPLIKARTEKSLTRQEKSILLDCETQIESLLANVFENYKSLDEDSPTGLADLTVPTLNSAPPALDPAVQVYTLLHDILSLDAQTILTNYLQTAARKRCRKHMVETDEFLSSNSEGYLDSITTSTAYLKMKSLCVNISNEIKEDIKIHQQHILPSSIDLSNITAVVYSTELCNRLRSFLAVWPPSSPQSHVNELLVATADFERDLELWSISPVEGGVDARNLFHNYIMVWVQDMQLGLLDLCKAEKVPWSGVTTNHSTSPFAEEMYEKMRDNLIQYEVVISRWPQYSLILENAVANVERAIIKALEKQYNDILTPLKDSIQKRLNLQVQKLARRQSITIYMVPNQLGTFLNTIKRILDVLHCRVEDILKSWASCIPIMGDKKSQFGEQINGITVLLKTKYKIYLQALVGKLVTNMQANRSTRLKWILEETREEDGEAEVRERMQVLNSQLVDSISNLHEVFTSQIFVATCRGFWDRMGQIILKFLEGRKENRVWYSGSYYAIGILEDTFASQMQRLQGNALQEKDLQPPRSVIEARSILCRDTANATDPSTYFYI
ncbi:Pesticidal crystal cry8Ba protein [Quillaja saponaria]|uniref:Pesticidal crystal cry8Ba protein n=1 Tax=Quillaja saponaria TaxID=32244 RepID=A0AAD7LUT9_QUISA|nr:Pesticidal crystal cry8Ba protein [Quillaja saponaria]